MGLLSLKLVSTCVNRSILLSLWDPLKILTKRLSFEKLILFSSDELIRTMSSAEVIFEAMCRRDSEHMTSQPLSVHSFMQFQLKRVSDVIFLF